MPYFNHTQPQIPSTKEITAQYGPTQPLIKSLLQTYESQGIIGVCKELSSDTSIVNTYRDTQVPPIIKSISKFIVGFIDFVNAPINPLIYAYVSYLMGLMYKKIKLTKFLNKLRMKTE